MAEHRHKRETNARRKPRAVLVAGPVALLATASVVSLGVLGADPVPGDLLAQDVAASAGGQIDPPAVPERQVVLSRAGSRIERVEKPTQVELLTAPAATRAAIGKAETRLWTTAALNLWTTPAESATKVGVLDEGEKVLVTGRSLLGREEIVLDGVARWVTAGYLSDEEPVAGLGADCTNGTSVPSGVSPNIVKVHQAVCAAFPTITTYGTFRSDGEHGQGIAVDIMVSGALGWEVAEFIRAHYAELGVSYLIYSQKIWSVERSGEGWRGMSDRGSATANHYDHVHVTTY
ncbi:mucin-2 protein [Nocardioides ferulae]|uniref:mucin-2 protein n=1 Tax=Nocardioides ferulae TaxID=2340821 RepID=UPI000EB0B874